MVRFARAYKKIIVVQENNCTKGLISTARYNGGGIFKNRTVLESLNVGDFFILCGGIREIMKNI